MNVFLEIEFSKANRKAAREVTKKAKTQGSYSSHSSFSGAPSYQGERHIPPRGVTSSEPSPMNALTLGSQVGSTFQSNLWSSGHSTPFVPLC